MVIRIYISVFNSFAIPKAGTSAAACASALKKMVNRINLGVIIIAILFSLSCFIISAQAQNAPSSPSSPLKYWKNIELSGKTLTISDVIDVARPQNGSFASVSISASALKRVAASNTLVKAAISKDIPAYGLKKVTDFWQESVEVSEVAPGEKELAPSEDPNIKTLLTLTLNAGAPFKTDVLRAAMLIRLNTILVGKTGATVELVYMLRDLLNKNIFPVSSEPSMFTKRDVFNQAIIALAMTGKGMVYYQGKKMSGDTALKAAGIKPIRLSVIDAHTLLETDSIAAAYALLTVNDIAQFIDNAEIIYSMTLDSIGGNISSLYKINLEAAPYSGVIKSAIRINQHLTGSYLLDETNSTNQDNIDLSSGVWEFGRARDVIDLIESNLQTRLNSPDADPIVQVVSDTLPEKTPLQSIYSIKTKDIRGSIYPLSIHDEIYWSNNIMNLVTALADISASSYQRIKTIAAKGILQNTQSETAPKNQPITGLIKDLNIEIRRSADILLLNESSVSSIENDNQSVSNRLLSRNVFVNEQLQLIMERLYYMITTEAILSAQMMDIKKKEDTFAQKTFGNETTALLISLRTQVPFINKENQIAKYINKVFQHIKTGELKKALIK